MNLIDLKTSYQKFISKKQSYGERLYKQYARIIHMDFIKYIVDIGCGDNSFVNYARKQGKFVKGVDYPIFDAEKDSLSCINETYNIVTLNAVIEHIKDPSNIMSEAFRVLDFGGFIIIRTTNFRMDYKNFYNDVTHVKPYTPESLKMLLELYGFHVVFMEPGLILKSRFWYKIPFKWTIAKYLTGGTKSVIIIGQKWRK